MLNKDKYGLQEYNFSGKLTNIEKEEAYQKYYEVKFKELCTKQANGIYEDFLSRVNTAYEKKKNSHLNNRSQYANYDQLLLAMPLKSQERVKEAIKTR